MTAMRKTSALYELFKLSGGADASDEDIRRVAEANPALWRRALEELAAGELHKAFADPQVAFGAPGSRSPYSVPLSKLTGSAGDAEDTDDQVGPAEAAIRARRRRREGQ